MADETPLGGWQPRPRPCPQLLAGRAVTLHAFRPGEDPADLWRGFGGTAFNALARYFPNDDFGDCDAFAAWLGSHHGRDWHVMVFRDIAGQVAGMASYMRIEPDHGSCEIGSICVAPAYQRSILATEAQFLLAAHVFDDLRYRRYEWKLNDANQPSHRAARRFGFVYEGLFRQHMVAKGRNRDTAWYSMTDRDWPSRRRAFELWLDPANFDADGRQKRRLESFREETGGAMRGDSASSDGAS